MNYEILQGDALATLKTLPANSVQTCITSPPYYGLRDYGTATWEGGDAACDHVERAAADVSKSNGLGKIPGYRDNLPATNAAFKSAERQYRDLCGKCGARRIDSQVGLEETPEAYVAKLVDVFREVRRVLHPTGTVWLNLGDSYNSATQMNGQRLNDRYDEGDRANGAWGGHRPMIKGLKPKDLIGIPWMVAFALRADGWYLRQDIIWSKGNCMPESVTDRCTKSHEYIFLLSKSPHYYYDNEAIKEAATNEGKTVTLGEKSFSKGQANGAGIKASGNGLVAEYTVPAGRNKRSVWHVNSRPYKMAHFATFPPDLIEPCILAGTSAYGACANCGAPWARVVEKGDPMPPVFGGKSHEGQEKYLDDVRKKNSQRWRAWKEDHPDINHGWQPTCACGCTDVVPCTVLDPFCGSGTTLAVALKYGRHGIGLELNEDYISLAHKRIGQAQPMLLLEGAL